MNFLINAAFEHLRMQNLLGAVFIRGRRLFHFFKCGVYWRAAFKRGNLSSLVKTCGQLNIWHGVKCKNFCVIKCVEASKVTLANHLTRLLYHNIRI